MASDTSAFIDSNTGVFTPDYSRWRAVETFLQRPLLASATANLTNNTGGTPSTTLAEITTTDTGAAVFGVTQNSVSQLANSVNGLLTANPNFIVAGTNMTSALSTFADGGGVTLTTAGASADQAILSANTNTGQSTWGTVKLNSSDRPGFGGVVKTGASIASAIIWFGLKLTDTPVVATDANQAFFRYEAGVDTNWQFVWSVAGEDYQFDTGIEVAASTSYSFWIYIAADRKPRLAIAQGVKNPDELVPGMPTTQYMTADIDLKVFAGVQASAAAAKAVTVRLLGASKDYND